MAGLDFKQINSVPEMVDFLKALGEKHREYHHYTNLGTLEKILEFGTLRLTRGNCVSMNDQHECTCKGTKDEWDKTYLACFAYGSDENMAMWGLYCLPWYKGIRITIKQAAMTQWIQELQAKPEVFSVENNGDLKEIKRSDVSLITLEDVLYIEGKEGSDKFRLKYKDGSRTIYKDDPLIGIDQKAEMTGFIKNSAWSYENEVRVLIKLKSPMDRDHITIKIPDYVFDNMTITSGPYVNYDVQKILEEKNLLYKHPRIKFQESGFKELVRYKKTWDVKFRMKRKKDHSE